MQTFVVRVYEQERESRRLCGVVNDAANGETGTFHDAEELLRILSGAAERRGGPMPNVEPAQADQVTGGKA